MTFYAEAKRLREDSRPAETTPFPLPPRAAPEAKTPEPTPAAPPSWFGRLLRRPLFLAAVVVPNVASVLYFGLIAAPVYTSTAALMVLNPKQSGPSLSSLLSGASGDSSEQGGYILKEYFASWDAFRKLDKPLGLAENFGKGDPVGRFGGVATGFRTNDVALWRYFQKQVDVKIDQKSGIVALDVSAWDAAYATRLTKVLLAAAIAHMDAMNAQQQGDFLKSAIARKAAIEAALRSDLAALAQFRNQTGTYDPKELYLSNLALMNSLTMKATELKSQGQALSAATPNNPQVDNLASATQSVKQDIATTAKSFPAMARSSSRYEKLLVSRDNNITLLGQANLALQEAQAAAEKNRYYLNVISSPSEPQTPEGPERLMWIGGVLLATLLLWGLIR